ncbi:nuclear transport factor 2 family protein [Janibacter alkaliphilus]|nr:nuclear transport factor 2 family protein [Janibacter alkaliphilus]
MSLHEQLTAQHRAMSRAMVDADTRALGSLLASSYTLTHMTGTEQTSARWLEEIASGEMDYHHVEDVDVTVSDGEGAEAAAPELTVRSLTDATIWGSRATWRLQLRHTFVRGEAGWLFARTVASTW